MVEGPAASAECTMSAAEPSAAGGRLRGLVSDSFIAWLEENRALMRYVEERRDFDTFLDGRLKNHYESYSEQAQQSKQRRSKRKRRTKQPTVSLLLSQGLAECHT